MLTVEELENGFYLDLPIQAFLIRYLNTNMNQVIYLDENHGEEFLVYLEIITMTLSILKTTTIVVDENIREFKLFTYRDNGIDVVKIYDIVKKSYSFLILGKDLLHWQNKIGKTKETYFKS